MLAQVLMVTRIDLLPSLRKAVGNCCSCDMVRTGDNLRKVALYNDKSE